MSEAPDRTPQWSLWRSFAVVVETGSLSAAGRKLGLSQPTLGRHIASLEAAIGTPLFERDNKMLRPTPAALSLYEPVARAGAALAEAAARAEGGNVTLKGTVRITASEVFSHYVLPSMLQKPRQQHPEIALEIVPSDSVENLLLREADIAVRMVRPTQLDLITRHIGDLPLTVCAHRSYLEARGTPQTPQDLMNHDLIGLDRSELIIAAARQMGFPLKREDFCIRSDSQTLLWELMKSGLGIGFAQTELVRATPGMVPILPQLTLPGLPLWLTTHRELFTSRRIRAIYDALAEALAAYCSAAHKA